MRSKLRQGLLLITGLTLGSGLTLGTQAFYRQQEQQAQQSPEAPKAITIPLGLRGDPKLGSGSAPLTIVEFSDFQCPYCKRFHDLVMPSLKKEYIDKGLVRFVHKDLPLPFHEHARNAAEAARCSRDDSQYWKTYGALFANQDCFACKGISTIVKASGIPVASLETCKRAKTASMAVNSNLAESQLQGIRSTPSFVIGPSQGERHTGQLVEGAMPWTRFKVLIEDALRENRPQ